ncbi:hypothetical protein JCM1840_005693 [Sporobolomyces johnsonii]
MAPQPPTKLTSATKLSAWVTVDDVPVPVYQVEEKGNKVTCFIEAAEGKEFKVGYENAGFSWSETVAWVHIDGTRMAGVPSRSKSQPAMIDGRRETPNTIRPFAFAKLVLTDDPDLASTDENFIKNLGTIQVHVYRIYYLGEQPFPNRVTDGVKNQVAHERSKKATLSHQATLGPVKATPQAGSSNVDYVDPQGQPSQIFEFKYRSRALLELEDIIECELSSSFPFPKAPNEPPLSSTSASAAAPTPPAPSAPRQPVAGPSTSKGNKRKASTPLQVDKDGAIVLLSDDDSDDDAPAGAQSKIARLEAEIERLKKIKEPGLAKVKKERLG